MPADSPATTGKRNYRDFFAGSFRVKKTWCAVRICILNLAGPGAGLHPGELSSVWVVVRSDGQQLPSGIRVFCEGQARLRWAPLQSRLGGRAGRGGGEANWTMQLRRPGNGRSEAGRSANRTTRPLNCAVASRVAPAAGRVVLPAGGREPTPSGYDSRMRRGAAFRSPDLKPRFPRDLLRRKLRPRERFAGR